MNRQVSYNSPLSLFPLPYNFPGSRSSTLMNHPLPPKPPISMYFHTYAPPPRKPSTVHCDMAAQHVDHGNSIPVNNKREELCSRHHATASSIRASSSPDIESVIQPSGEDTFPELENDDFDETVGIDGDDFRGDANHSGGDGNGPMNHLSNGSEGELSKTLGPTLAASCQLVGSQLTQPVTETTLCTVSQTPRPKRLNRKRPACTVLRYARTRAEASCSFSSCRRTRPYSNIEDELLRKLVHRKLPWEQIEKEFGQYFAGRDLKSLQGRWSRSMKFVARPARYSKRRGALK
ncbi:hypothetical protein BJX99DRAFT_252523 [Aspergillus californicus]